MGSENLDVNRGRAAGRPGESGCERVFPAQFFAAVFHPDGGPTPGTPPGRRGNRRPRAGAKRPEGRHGQPDRSGGQPDRGASRKPTIATAMRSIAWRCSSPESEGARGRGRRCLEAWWQAPGNVDLGEQGLRSALAGAVYSRCLDAPTARNRRRQGASGLGRSPPCRVCSGICWRWFGSVSTLVRQAAAAWALATTRRRACSRTR